MTRRWLAGVVVAGALFAAAPASAAAINTSITSGPNGLVASRTATFRFASTTAPATFQCRLDASAWSSCASPKKYTGLSQGQHTFQVRAKSGGAVDPTPALRAFTVDTIGPDTSITAGPSGLTNDLTPSFSFSSPEPATFQCRLTTTKYSACDSPFTPASPLADGAYTFEVRSRDVAGNLDKTPASRAITVERLLTNDLETAEAAAALYFPDDSVVDVQPTCDDVPGNDLDLDCPGNTPLPASGQLRTSSTREVAAVGPTSYDVTVTSDVATLRRVALNWGESVDCGLSLASAYGDDPTWTVSLQLAFEGGSEPRLTYDGLGVDGLELPDWGIERWTSATDATICGRFPGLSSDLVTDAYALMLEAHLAQVGAPLCAAPGPAYLGPCDGGPGAPLPGPDAPAASTRLPAAAAPETTIVSGPTGPVASRSATFTFTSTPQGATFQCKLDDAAWATCDSPRKYANLSQGEHVFRVRARRDGTVDATPAVSFFTVDTVPPDTILTEATTGACADGTGCADRYAFRVPDFSPTSTEGTVECRLDSLAYAPCTIPHVPENLQPDRDHVLQARGRDAAGNVDPTPAAFEVDKVGLMPNTLELGEAAAEQLVPDQLTLDVPPNCGGSPSIDCPGGTPTPPSDQLSLSASRSVVKVAGQDRFDVTATMAVVTLQAIDVNVPLVGDCKITLNSANGATPTWTVNQPVHYVLHQGDLDTEASLVLGSSVVNGVENEDVQITGTNFGCQFAGLGIGFFIGTFTDSLADMLTELGPVCMAPGPALFERCPWASEQG